MTERRPQVVIIGAGFAGLAAARGLRHEDVDVVLIDRENYHLFQPLLYQVASGLLDPAEIAHPVRSIVRRHRNCEVRMAEVTAVDTAEQIVRTDSGAIAYDYLIVAAGSRTNYFGNNALQQCALGLKTLGDALALRSHILRMFERAALSPDAATRRRLLTFVVAGGGPTGVEYAGALCELIRHVIPKDFPHLDSGDIRVELVEGAGALLPAFAAQLSAKAQRVLERKGARIHLDRRVNGIDAEGVVLDDGTRIVAATVVWTAGVCAAPLAAMLGAANGSQGRVRVDRTLQIPGRRGVFVVGDLAEISDGNEPLPMLAPVAIQSGEHAARGIDALLHNRPAPTFVYKDKGMMATVGRNCAVVQSGRLHLAGFAGWVVWLFLHLLYIVSFRSRLFVLINWSWNYVFLDRPVRLITLPARSPGDGIEPAD